MIVLVPFLILALLVASVYLRKRPQVLKKMTAKDAFYAYQTKYYSSTQDKSKTYNRVAFHLVDNTPMFLDDNPFTSAYIQPAERETLTAEDEVYCMVVAPSSRFGYISYRNKQAKQAVLLVFRSAPFREVGLCGTGFSNSWRLNDVNYHVINDHFMNYDQVTHFMNESIAEYKFNEKY
jgi:hypothetical protein